MDQQLKQLLSDVPEVVLLKPSTGSTNDDVKALIAQGTHTALVCSEIQTKGRGQHHRTWQSPKGNIYFSTILNTQKPLDGRLSLEIALNLIHMPCLAHFKNLSIKWANDLYSSQGKWGGILLEPISPHQVVVGIGINILPRPELQQLDQAVTSLSQLGHLTASKIELIAQMYIAVQQAGQWFEHDCRNLAARFNHVAMYKNTNVQFETHEKTIEGLFLGIQNDGAVQIQTQNKIEVFYQGRLRHA